MRETISLSGDDPPFLTLYSGIPNGKFSEVGRLNSHASGDGPETIGVVSVLHPSTS